MEMGGSMGVGQRSAQTSVSKGDNVQGPRLQLGVGVSRRAVTL